MNIIKFFFYIVFMIVTTQSFCSASECDLDREIFTDYLYTNSFSALPVRFAFDEFNLLRKNSKKQVIYGDMLLADTLEDTPLYKSFMELFRTYHYALTPVNNGYIITSPKSELKLIQKCFTTKQDLFGNRILIAFYNGYLQSNRYSISFKGNVGILFKLVTSDRMDAPILSMRIGFDIANRTVKSGASLILPLFKSDVDNILAKYISFIQKDRGINIRSKIKQNDENKSHPFLLTAVIFVLVFSLWKANRKLK